MGNFFAVEAVYLLIFGVLYLIGNDYFREFAGVGILMGVGAGLLMGLFYVLIGQGFLEGLVSGHFIGLAVTCFIAFMGKNSERQTNDCDGEKRPSSEDTSVSDGSDRGT